MLHQGSSIASKSLRKRASSPVDLVVTKLQLYNGARAQSGPIDIIDEVALRVTKFQANFPLEPGALGLPAEHSSGQLYTHLYRQKSAMHPPSWGTLGASPGTGLSVCTPACMHSRCSRSSYIAS